ncbi:MAG: type II secretion system protein [Ruminococcaceae bacterium]|nr:type II secretion system protein [Oscillospiraceae bacterium]
MKKFLKNQKGITMMEVLVTVGLLAIVIVPCLSSFVMAQRGNALASQVYYEYTEAQNLMETLKGIPVPEGEDGLDAWNEEINRTLADAQSDYIAIDKNEVLDGDGNFLYYTIDIKNKRDGELILEGVIAP